MYIIFKVVPYHRNIARPILKAPKYYFYDTGQVVGDFGVKLENLVACSLLKEIDFFVTKNDTPSVDGRSKMGGRKGEFEFYSFREVFPWG